VSLLIFYLPTAMLHHFAREDAVIPTSFFCRSYTALVAGAFALTLSACGDESVQTKSESVAVTPEATTASSTQADTGQTMAGSVAVTQPASSATSALPPVDPNKVLAGKVKNALEAEPRVNGQGIDVTAADGIVSLWGTVADAAERRKAESVATSQPGVKSVNNRLVIVKGS
jgi:hyperosmotically inducible periplasmic protein